MKKTKCFLMIAMVSLMLSIGGSQALALFKGYGSLVASNEVTQAFDDYRLYPDLNYYFSGADAWPDAISDSTLWSMVVATSDILKNLVSGMKSRPLTSPLHGYAILDDKGKQIGVWYSMFGVRGYVRMEGERTVEIATPINPQRPELRAPLKKTYYDVLRDNLETKRS